VAAARPDPAVAPTRPFAAEDAILGNKRLHVLDAEHFAHPGWAPQDQDLLAELRACFTPR
jgi:cephalosporin-C deacetylase